MTMFEELMRRFILPGMVSRTCLRPASQYPCLGRKILSMETRRKKPMFLPYGVRIPFCTEASTPSPPCFGSFSIEQGETRQKSPTSRRCRLCETVCSPSLSWQRCFSFRGRCSLFVRPIQQRFFRGRTNQRRLGNLGGTSRDAGAARRGAAGRGFHCACRVV